MVENCEKLNNQALLLAQSGQYPEAIACLKRAITMEAKNSLLWFNLGITYRDSGDTENAISCLQNAARLNPEDEDIIETLATLFFQTGQSDEALYVVIRGLYVNDQNPHFWNLMGVLYFNQDLFEDAAEQFEKAVALNPYYTDALLNLQDTYTQLNNTAGVQQIQATLNSFKK